MPEQDDALKRVQEYEKLVLAYEALDEVIDAMLTQYRGQTEEMSVEELNRYREMFRERNEMLNQLRFMEHELMIEDDDTWRNRPQT
jgi:hypothetical protein